MTASTRASGITRASPAASAQAKASNAARPVPRPQVRAAAIATTAPISPSAPIDGAATSGRAPASTDRLALGSCPDPNGKPAPPVAQYSPNAPYSSDQPAVAYPTHSGHRRHQGGAGRAEPAAGSRARWLSARGAPAGNVPRNASE